MSSNSNQTGNFKPSSTSSKKNRILYVDDNAIDLKLVENILSHDYEILLAKDSKEAFDILKTYEIDLLLLDILMPGMDGLTFLDELKNHSEYLEMPVIFLTVKDGPSDIEYGLAKGANDYVIKPFHPMVLKSRVANHITMFNTRKCEIELEKLRTMESVIVSLNHEINNPLTIISVTIELLKGTMKNEKGILILDRMQNSTDKIAEVLFKVKRLNEIRKVNMGQDFFKVIESVF